MAVQLSAPGVYVEEVPSGARAIAGVSTSVTAFVGPCARGSTEVTSAPPRIGSWADFERVFGGLTVDSELSYAVRQFFLNGGREALIVRVVGAGAAPARFALNGGLVLEANSPGTWGNTLELSVSHGATLDDPGPDGFHLTITDTSTDAVEEFRFLSVAPGAARQVINVLNTRSKLVRVATGRGTRPSEVTNFGPTTVGSNGSAVTANDVSTAAERLNLADTVNLVVVPRYDASSVGSAAYSALLTLCENLRAILLVDPASAWGDYEDAADMTGLTMLQSPNAILLHPRVQAVDPLRDNLAREFDPSGFVAGIIARTDAQRGVWKAPAGLEAALRGVNAPSEVLTEGAVGVLNARGVNALSVRPAVGTVLWGSRTMFGSDTRASEWKYIPVRRTALFIEESMRRGLQWAVFEPNDEPLWSQIRASVGSFMQRLFEAGAFQGTAPQQAYSVKCDPETTTPADVERGIVNILVGFAPLKPAEFVVLKFQQIAGQSGS